MAKGKRPTRGMQRDADGVELVPYEDWGDPLSNSYGVRNGTIDEYGDDFHAVTEDFLRHVLEPYDEPLTKKDALNVVRSFRNDDGTYGDEDYHIYVAYEDGTSFANGWEEAGGRWRKRFTTRGVIGISVQTPDDEYAWGEDWAGGDANRHRVPMQTWSEDGESGKTNTHAGHKTTGVYWERVRTTYRAGQQYPDHETLRRSTVARPPWLR